MAEDKSDNFRKKRPVLGDLTNQLGNGNKRTAESRGSNSQFWKRVSLAVENLERERCKAKCPKVGNEVGLSPLKGGKTYRLQTPSATSGSVHGITQMGPPKEPSGSALDNIDLSESWGFGSVANVNDTIKESCVASVTMVENSKSAKRKCLEEGQECRGVEARGLPYVVESDCMEEWLGVQVVSDDDMNLGVDHRISSKSESVVSSRLTEAQDEKSFGLEKCSALISDSSSSLAAGSDLLKLCSCSFCTKAAYIWSDLHYQDVKGRILILTKSQREASNLAQSYSAENEMGRQVEGNSTKVTSLEADLMDQWKSLFLHMENIVVGENNQLQTNFLVLKDLRENFKMNLEMINGMPSDVQQSSSDASDHVII